MARIIVAVYMFRYPLGGMLSFYLQWLVGLRQLGHDVFVVEKANYSHACFDPTTGEMADDPSAGIGIVSNLLRQFNLDERWCFADAKGHYYGITRERMETIFRHADLYLDLGNHGAWLKECGDKACSVLVDGEPGYTQMRMEQRRQAGDILPMFDFYYTNGANLGQPTCRAPTAGIEWRAIYNPVVIDLFEDVSTNGAGPFTTVMNWQAHEKIEYQGSVYGQKDIEFEKFMDLPSRVHSVMELAAHGDLPLDQLHRHGWCVKSAHKVTTSFAGYLGYIKHSGGEFSVCKNIFVSTRSGWFSDRSAAYLASGRPVVLQDTGFSEYLPCGMGLFAAQTVEQAADAICQVESDYTKHSKAARAIANEYFDATKVLNSLIDQVAQNYG